MGGSVKDNLFGNSGADILRGGSRDDILTGGSGNDTLYGDSGNDRLIGGIGEDILTSGSGDDFLDGGAGRNILHWDIGKDTFFITTGSNSSVILDYEIGVDLVQILSSISVSDLRITAIGDDGDLSNLGIYYGEDKMVEVRNITDTSAINFV